METLKKVLTVILSITIVLALCFLILCGCVKIGMSIFGTEAFGAELPSIEEPCGMSTEEFESVLKGEFKQYAQEFLHAEEDYQINIGKIWCPDGGEWVRLVTGIYGGMIK